MNLIIELVSRQKLLIEIVNWWLKIEKNMLEIQLFVHLNVSTTIIIIEESNSNSTRVLWNVILLYLRYFGLFFFSYPRFFIRRFIDLSHLAFSFNLILVLFGFIPSKEWRLNQLSQLFLFFQKCIFLILWILWNIWSINLIFLLTVDLSLSRQWVSLLFHNFFAIF
jgi:hypothetical protein